MIDKLSEAIAGLLPAELGRELRANIEAVVRANLEKMNLLTREQFEIQEKVLHRTRARMLELEQRVAQLEQRLNLAAEKKRGEKNAEKSVEKGGEKAAKTHQKADPKGPPPPPE